MAKKTNKLAALNMTQIDDPTLICHGSCSGDVEIAEGGFFECHGSMSGNVTNNGGGYEIHGSFAGEVYGDSDNDEEDYDIDEDN